MLCCAHVIVYEHPWRDCARLLVMCWSNVDGPLLGHFWTVAELRSGQEQFLPKPYRLYDVRSLYQVWKSVVRLVVVKMLYCRSCVTRTVAGEHLNSSWRVWRKGLGSTDSCQIGTTFFAKDFDVCPTIPWIQALVQWKNILERAVEGRNAIQEGLERPKPLGSLGIIIWWSFIYVSYSYVFRLCLRTWVANPL